MRTLIQNGTVVNASGSERADVLLEDGLIAAVGEAARCQDAEVVEASGMLVMPGFIDAHTHFDLDVGACVTADNFITGTAAAVLGGTTTVIDFATQSRGGTLSRTLEEWKKKAEGSSSNFGFHMAIAGWNEAVANEMPDMTAAGVTSYKMYMVYDSMKVDDGAIYQAMKRAKDEGAFVSVHCENWDVLRARIKEEKAAGHMGADAHPRSRPEDVEAEAVSRYMRIARLADAPAYVVHLSTAEGLEEALRARKRGQAVCLETCPQYLLLTDACYLREDGAKFVMSPPLRKATDNERLWRAVAEGEIDVVGTDHCSFTMAQKAIGKYDFSKIPNGAPGVGDRPRLMYTYGVRSGRMSIGRMVECLSAAPARVFGMPNRGVIAPGMAADIVVWDENARARITDTNHAHNCDNSPFSGLDVMGAARDVFVNGVRAVRDCALLCPGEGKFIKRQRCDIKK